MENIHRDITLRDIFSFVWSIIAIALLSGSAVIYLIRPPFYEEDKIKVVFSSLGIGLAMEIPVILTIYIVSYREYLLQRARNLIV